MDLNDVLADEMTLPAESALMRDLANQSLTLINHDLRCGRKGSRNFCLESVIRIHKVNGRLAEGGAVVKIQFGTHAVPDRQVNRGRSGAEFIPVSHRHLALKLSIMYSKCLSLSHNSAHTNVMRHSR